MSGNRKKPSKIVTLLNLLLSILSNPEIIFSLRGESCSESYFLYFFSSVFVPFFKSQSDP